MHQYLVPIKSKQDNSFAFMLIIEAESQHGAKVIASYIYHNDLQDHLYIDYSKDFKEYQVV